MKTDAFIAKLEKVRTTGSGTWIACCPAHEDQHPSMTIREADDRVLVHCFAGCSVEQILTAVGMDFDALFPEKPRHHVKQFRRPFPAADVLESVAKETWLIAVAAQNLSRGGVMTAKDQARLQLAAERIFEARRYALG